jgi:hypothetical protein
VTAEGGYPAVLLMGFVFTVTAFTCTAPIVGTLLAALTRRLAAAHIAGMFVYSWPSRCPSCCWRCSRARCAAAGRGRMITVKA